MLIIRPMNPSRNGWAAGAVILRRSRRGVLPLRCRQGRAGRRRWRGGRRRAGRAPRRRAARSVTGRGPRLVRDAIVGVRDQYLHGVAVRKRHDDLRRRPEIHEPVDHAGHVVLTGRAVTRRCGRARVGSRSSPSRCRSDRRPTAAQLDVVERDVGSPPAAARRPPP